MAGLLDFNANFASSPAFASAWGNVQKQLAAEGADDSLVTQAKISMASAFEQLSSNITQTTSLKPEDIAKKAGDYVVAGNTILGAVQNVQGLISAASSPDPTPIFNMFAGTLIGAMVTIGAVSAGVGAAIVGAVAVTFEAMRALGLFGSTPAGQEICPGLFVNPPPTFVINCVGTNANTVETGALIWRRFPERNGPNAGDNDWYTAGSTSWAGSALGQKYDWSGFLERRLIDSAFPQWHYMMCANVPLQLQPFWQGYLSAWKANAEFAFNGYKPLSDAQVLVQYTRFWNKAHAATSTYTLAGAQMPFLAPVTLDDIKRGVKCPANLPFYPATLMQGVLALAANDLFSSGGLRINMGAMNTPKRVVVLNIGALLKKPTAASSSAGKTALYVAGGSIAAAAIYGYVAKKDAGYVFKRAWGGARKLPRKVFHGASETKKPIRLVARLHRSRR